ncbi:octanoyltransferase [Parasponia andersonii]|uniref:Octanoyltransferase n=1 Tax=Parasponia andersonii TaxID=3476 RepID=A0A2P5DQY8_PARAD|nr:octanoyltransferase [Parasponia andersonii]
MDEREFRRLLDLFPVVRSRDFVVESESSRQSTSKPSRNEELKEWQDAWQEGGNKQIEIKGLDQRDAFWKKLKSAAERKVGAAEAERFCKTFRRIHNKLVYEELSSEAAQNLLKLSRTCDT